MYWPYYDVPHCCHRELASNLSADLIRDFDERWWQAAKKVMLNHTVTQAHEPCQASHMRISLSVTL
jgi:hypothetical protein